MKRAACLDALVEIGRDSRVAAEDSDAADLGPGVLLLSVHRVDEGDHVGGEVSEPSHAAELCVAHGCSADRLRVRAEWSVRVAVRRFEVQPRTAKERHHNLLVRAAHLLSADDGVERAGKARGVACPQRPWPRLGGLPKRAVHDGRNPAQPATLCQQATLEPRRACVPVQVHECHATELHKVLL